jgi:hypothetical protein
VAINFLYFEEERPLRALRAALVDGNGVEIRARFFDIEARVKAVDGEMHGRVSSALFGGSGDASGAIEQLRRFVEDVPKSFWPREKMERVIERVASTGVEGISIFSEGQIGGYGLWDCFREAFAGEVSKV